MPIPKPRFPRKRRRGAAALALLVAAAAVVVIATSNSGNTRNNSGAGTTATGAATVQRRNLVATDTESGTLSYADPQTVYNRLSGTITWVPRVGQVIRPGQRLFTVDNKPVMLMNGSTPAFRSLTASDEKGPDVYELNRNLVDLGYNPDGIVVDDTWQAATTAGVDELQYHLGETQTGQLALGQVVFLPGPQMVQTVDTTVGSTGGAGASYTVPSGTSKTEFVDYSKDTTSTSSDTTSGTTATPTDTTPASTTTPSTSTGTSPTPANGSSDSKALQELIQTLRQQTAELRAAIQAARSHPSAGANPSSGQKSPSKPSKSPSSSASKPSSASPSGAGGGGNAVAVLATSSTKLVVTVDLGASVQSEATIGEKVTVEMPNGTTTGGHVTAVSPVAQSSSSGGSGAGSGGGDSGGSGSGSSTVPVTVTLDKPATGGGLDQASVSVNFVQSKADNVLSVPVTALLATSGSTFAVQDAAAPHRLIPVQTGLFAAGFVEISGSGIYPGLQVTDSQG